MMHGLPRLDLMIAYSCNISCRGCISISDRKRSGVEPYEALEQSIAQWCQRLDPRLITLFGGEPCLHPRLLDICALTRRSWPKSRIRLITNGYLLDRFDPAGWFEFGDFEIQVSLHRLDHRKKIDSVLAAIMQQRRPWSVRRLGGENQHHQMAFSHGSMTIYKSVFQEFVVPFRGSVDNIQPWNSDPAQAHAICGAPNTPVLYKSKLYKCPAVANALDLTNHNWFDYVPKSVEDDLGDFVNNIGKPESCCGQCPDRDRAVIVDHFDKNNVIVRQKNIS